MLYKKMMSKAGGRVVLARYFIPVNDGGGLEMWLAGKVRVWHA